MRREFQLESAVSLTLMVTLALSCWGPGPSSGGTVHDGISCWVQEGRFCSKHAAWSVWVVLSSCLTSTLGPCWVHS